MEINTTSAKAKEVVEVRLGRYSVTLDKDKMETLHGFCSSGDTEIGYIREIMDLLLDMCLGCVPTEAECLKHMKNLTCIRQDYENLKDFGVKFGKDA